MKKLVLLLTIVTCCASGASGDYMENPDLKALVNEVAASGSYTEEELYTLFSDVKQKESILEAIARPAESVLTWAEYQKIFLDGKRETQGVIFWQEHEATLKNAEQEFGVPAEIIVAIIGVETRYGKHRGGYRVIDALSTLAFDYPPRSKFFRKELVNFLLLCKEAHIDPAEAMGSYAGAMGYGQFIPSSYRAYAVDYDKDGVTDIINNPVDAIGSVANYFKQHGWKTGEPVVARAEITSQSYSEVIPEKESLRPKKPKHSLAELQASGLKPLSCSAGQHSPYCFDVNEDEAASALKLLGTRGAEFWIGLKNFYVITRYNHSNLYAMAVYQLSQEITRLR